MKSLRSRQGIFISLLGLAGLAVVLLALLPPEQTIGSLIRPVILHGALVQVGLFAYSAAGIFGLVYLLRRSESICGWCLASQKAALAIWSVAVISSAVTTYLAWGEWIAWDEPRTHATAYVLLFSAICLLLVLWVRNHVFTALVNVTVAVMAWYLIKGANLVRHPFDPIGSSGSTTYRLLYIAVLVVVLLAGVLLIRAIQMSQSGCLSENHPQDPA